MCAAVAVMPVTVIFALTERSSLMVTVPEPDADVVTGGTSFAPRSDTCSPLIVGAIDWQLASNPTAPARVIAAIHLSFCNIIVLMFVLLEVGNIDAA